MDIRNNDAQPRRKTAFSHRNSKYFELIVRLNRIKTKETITRTPSDKQHHTRYWTLRCASLPSHSPSSSPVFLTFTVYLGAKRSVKWRAIAKLNAQSSGTAFELHLPEKKCNSSTLSLNRTMVCEYVLMQWLGRTVSCEVESKVDGMTWIFFCARSRIDKNKLFVWRPMQLKSTHTSQWVKSFNSTHVGLFWCVWLRFKRIRISQRRKHYYFVLWSNWRWKHLSKSIFTRTIVLFLPLMVHPIK